MDSQELLRGDTPLSWPGGELPTAKSSILRGSRVAIDKGRRMRYKAQRKTNAVLPALKYGFESERAL